MDFTRRRAQLTLITLLFVSFAATTGAQSPGRAAVPDDQPGGDLPYPLARPPEPGDIYHVPTGLAMSFDGMMDMVSGARLVCVGETHDNIHAHEVELRVIRDLYRRFPGRIAIGMEMFREPQQAALDRWTKGELNELDFLKAVDWQRTWGMDFGYYRAILDFARDEHIDVVALNPPQDLQDQVEEHGLDQLPPDVKAQLPEIGEPDKYERALMKAIYGGHVPTEGMFDAFFRVQLLWEETMAQRVVEYLKSPRGRDKIMITLTGAGHVEYGFGLPKKVLRQMPMPYVIVEPEEIEIPAGKQMMNVEMPDIPLMPADFVWWVPYEDRSAQTVHLGVRLDEKAARPLVVDVQKGSAAEAAGIQPGDEIVAFAGHTVGDLTELLYWIDKEKKGDRVTVAVRRGGQTLKLQVTF